MNWNKSFGENWGKGIHEPGGNQKLAENDRPSGGLPAFPVGNAPPLPFICYLFSSTNNFNADDVVYQVINRISIELYTENKDLEAENVVEAALKDLCWEKSEEYLDDEQCYEIIYEIEV